MSQFVISKATKQQAKGRVGFIGASGSGKTYTALLTATTIAQAAGGRVCVIDTENRSASKYADEFDFDVLALDTFEPATYVAALEFIVKSGQYAVAIIDSLSHAWMGRGGALEMVDRAAAKSPSRNSFDAWRQVTPEHNKLVDALVRCPIHLIVTMRTTTEWVVEENDRGKKVPRRVGLKPIQRDGLEYEFDVVADLDLENVLTVSKTRCKKLKDWHESKPGSKFAETFYAWLTDGAPPDVEEVKPQQSPVTTDFATNIDGAMTVAALQAMAADIDAASKGGKLSAEDLAALKVRWRDRRNALAKTQPQNDTKAGGAA